MKNDIENQKKLSQGEFIKWVVLFMLLLLVGYFLWGYKLFEEKIGKLSQDKQPGGLIEISRVSQFEETCKKLSAEKEYNYIPVRAYAKSVSPYPPEPCRPPNPICPEVRYTFIIRMHPLLRSEEGDQELIVYTKPKLYGELGKIGGIIQREKSYKFCAREVEYFDFLPKEKTHNEEGRKIFKIDHLETIQPYNPTDNLKITPPDSAE